jgi:uncharacterized protein YdhG (YjbR/CyaY superfamily)
MRSAATSVEAYLAELPPERREAIARVREVVNRYLPAGYHETVSFGMISWGVPLARYPKTYNQQPLAYAALAAQKHYSVLYLMSVYGNPEAEARLRAAFDEAGLKLDFGKSCIRFRKPEDLPLEKLGELIADTSVEQHIANYEAARAK